MTRLRLELNSWSVHFDRDYGLANRTGWSIAHNGSFLVTFAPLHRALWLAWKRRKWLV